MIAVSCELKLKNVRTVVTIHRVFVCHFGSSFPSPSLWLLQFLSASPVLSSIALHAWILLVPSFWP